MTKEREAVSIHILGRTYPIFVSDEDRSSINSIEENIARQLKDYKLKYTQLDNQDCLSMALIEAHLLSSVSEEKASEDLIEIEQQLFEIDQKLHDALTHI